MSDETFETLGSTEKDYADKTSVKEALEGKVVKILQKELQGRVKKLYNERGFAYIQGEIEIFDFIRVDEPEDVSDGRFIMVIYAKNDTNSHYDPRTYKSWDFYPTGSKEKEIGGAFCQSLENGKIPKRVFHQILVPQSEGNHYSTYEPLCLWVKDKKDIEEIEKLVGIAVKYGMRDEIIVKRPEDLKEILGRIENDDSLKFDYWDNSESWRT